MSTAFVRHLKALELNGKGIKATHWGRAFFATAKRNQENIDPLTIQNLLGHSDIRVTERYFSEPDHAQKDAMKNAKNPFEVVK